MDASTDYISSFKSHLLSPWLCTGIVPHIKLKQITIILFIHKQRDRTCYNLFYFIYFIFFGLGAHESTFPVRGENFNPGSLETKPTNSVNLLLYHELGWYLAYFKINFRTGVTVSGEFSTFQLKRWNLLWHTQNKVGVL